MRSVPSLTLSPTTASPRALPVTPARRAASFGSSRDREQACAGGDTTTTPHVLPAPLSRPRTTCRCWTHALTCHVNASLIPDRPDRVCPLCSGRVRARPAPVRRCGRRASRSVPPGRFESSDIWRCCHTARAASAARRDCCDAETHSVACGGRWALLGMTPYAWRGTRTTDAAAVIEREGLTTTIDVVVETVESARVGGWRAEEEGV